MAQQKHVAWQQQTRQGSTFQGIALERRVLLITRAEALDVYEAVLGLEQLTNDMLQHPLVYSWPWQWRFKPAKSPDGELLPVAE